MILGGKYVPGTDETFPVPTAEKRRAILDELALAEYQDGLYTSPCSSVGLERTPDKGEVRGSMPLTATKFEE